ncbi:mechanosensitive ion channel domain-containing protein [Thioalkalivibrio sp. XN8]|uniref:mechanosensitive ion channel family protein n=1 Tax=Thioalkalivibrio sp. XN8 TaxID=2712863 RepID=UPI0013ED855D|nr:mechanosensitive ion channel domain-containing protein [Thioalkalivibrio sp. XN8]NGP54386.1 mechanosensitive ion channel [Thioalkalivibrio sp. XN8]
MEEWYNPEQLSQWVGTAWAWVRAEVIVWPSLLQLLAVLSTLLLAAVVGPRLRRFLGKIGGTGRGQRIVAASGPLLLPLLWLLLVGLAWQVAVLQAWPARILEIAVSLLSAWVVIHLASMVIRNPVWSRAVAISAWTVAALNILRLLEPTVTLLDGVAMQLGGVRISLLSLVKSVFALAVLLWVATALSELLETRLRHSPNLTPSVKALFGKLLKFSLVTLAVLAAITTTGIDLTALAVFGGALGVGIGLGLQRVVANLVSGIILLVDKSIKPGDVVAVAGTYGWVNTLGGRYVSVITRDGIEHLIPNEEFIATTVENWTHSDTKIRVKIPIGVHYKSDVERAIAVCEECAGEVDRVIADPGPVCQLRNFGDSAVELELRIWIADPMNGVNNVRSETLRRIWRAFHEEGIEIPYPQRDLHLASAVPLEVRLGQGQGEEAK